MKRIINFRLPITIYAGACPTEHFARIFRTTARQEGKSAFYAGQLGVPHPGPSAADEEPVNTCGPATDHPSPKPSPADVRREQIIHSMCMTRRHDYGLIIEAEYKALHPLLGGMTHDEREALFNQMAQLYEHHIAPILKDLDREKELRDQCNGSLNKAVEQTMTQKYQIQTLTADLKDPSRIHEYMGKRLDYWLELEAQAEMLGVQNAIEANAAYRGELLAITAVLGRAGTGYDIKWMVQEIDRLKVANKLLGEKLVTSGTNNTGWMEAIQKITGKLKLRAEAPIEVILDTIESYKQHAERYRTHNRTLANGDRLISQDEYERLLQGTCPPNTVPLHATEYDRLLAIERGHQTDKADARAAEAALERAHSDISTFASEAGFPRQVTADGSRRAALQQVLSSLKQYHAIHNDMAMQNHSMKEQRGLIRAALKRAGIDEVTPEHVSVTDLATRYLQARTALIATGCNDLFCEESARACQQCPAGQLKIEQPEKPVFGLSPLTMAISTYREQNKLVDMAVRENAQLRGDHEALRQRLSEVLQQQIGDHNADIIQAVWATRQAFEDSEKGRVRATRTIEALRKIVKYQAPHTPTCTRPATGPCPQTKDAPNQVDCSRCGKEACSHRYGTPNGQPYSANFVLCDCWKAAFMAEVNKADDDLAAEA